METLELPERKFTSKDVVYRLTKVDENTTTIEKHTVTGEGYSKITKVTLENDEDVYTDVIVSTISTNRLGKDIFLQEKEFFTFEELPNAIKPTLIQHSYKI